MSKQPTYGERTPSCDWEGPAPPACKECKCRTGGGEFCFSHAPYTVYPKADGSFHSDRNGRHHVWLCHPPSNESEAGEAAPRDPLRALLTAKVDKWRQEAAKIDRFHATMGTGYRACAAELEEALR